MEFDFSEGPQTIEFDSEVILKAMKVVADCAAGISEMMEEAVDNLSGVLDRFADTVAHILQHCFIGLLGRRHRHTLPASSSAAYLWAFKTVRIICITIVEPENAHISLFTYLLRKQDRGNDEGSEGIGIPYHSLALVAA